MLNNLTTAFRTLSNLPVPGKDTQTYASSLYGFVIVGLTLGSLLFAEAYGLKLLFASKWPEGAAIMVMITGIWLTRGFHLDGLADFGDAFWGGYDRERTLAIMKDTTLGTFGVVSLIILLLAKWIALVRLFEVSGLIWIVSAFVISRAMMVELIVCLPYARKEGTAGPFVEGAAGKHRLAAWSLATIALYLLNGYVGLIVLVLVWILTRVFGVWCLKRVGGITGDLLGTCCELTETLVLYFAVLLLLMDFTLF
jgi:adenosylcobinamide-GDP ribazoletransferase